jgi:ankyrin repeat protein
VVSGSEEEDNWKKRNPQGYKIMEGPRTIGSTGAHQAAAEGDEKSLMRLLKENPQLANAKDINNWTPLHVCLIVGSL